MKLNFLTVSMVFLLFQSVVLFGENNKTGFESDSVIIFKSPHPLVDYNPNSSDKSSVFGADIFFSKTGYGFGVFWEHKINKTFTLNAKFFGSVVKNTDELERYDYNRNIYVVVDKINRIFMTPLLVEGKYNLFVDDITNSFQPFLSVAAGPAFIYKMPYRENSDVNGEFIDFFSAAGDTEFYTRFAAAIGTGFSFAFGKSHTSLNIEYYFIPFSDEGLESTAERPIKDFGGLNFSISVGMIY